MPAPQWQHEPGVMGALLRAPHSFGAYQALRLIDDGTQLLDKRLRLEGSCTLAFPTCEVQRISLSDGGKVTVTLPGFSYLGVSGALPYTYTERVNARIQSHRDDSWRAFFDQTATRAVLHLYRAWSMARVDASNGLFERRQQALSSRAMPHPARARLAAIIRQPRLSARLLTQALKDVLALPLEVRSLQGGWEETPEPERMKLGRSGCGLGKSTMLGSREWRIDRRIRLVIGPLDASAFREFLKEGAGRAELAALKSLFQLSNVAIDVQPLLRAQGIPAARLSSAAHGTLGLGQGITLGSRPDASPLDTLVYTL